MGPSLGRRGSRRDHHLELTALDHLAGRSVGDVRVAEGADVLLEVIGRILRKQHLDVLADVALQEPRVEVVAVPVRDPEEIGLASEALPVQTTVVGGTGTRIRRTRVRGPGRR